MAEMHSREIIPRLAPNGYFIGLRTRFAFPAEEVNALPTAWVELYSREKYFFGDPSLRWSFKHNGAIRWGELAGDDPLGIIARSAEFGLRFGAVASVREENGTRSFGLFFRPGREYTAFELEGLAGLISGLHAESAPPETLSQAEIDVLKAIKKGRRLKEIAYDLGVTEGAIKLRLKKARLKLGATTGAQAAAMARDCGLI